MPDPISSVIIAGAAGGAAGKFIEKTCDSGSKWLSDWYKGHQHKASEAAKENSNEFLYRLATKVHTLEAESEANSAIINAALEDPHFGALMQKALYTSSQTKNPEKHEVLAQLVSNRLKAEPESIYAMASQAACDTIANLTTRQMKTLAVTATITMIRPVGLKERSFSERRFYEIYCNTWLELNLNKVIDIKPTNYDIKHLEAMSCARPSFGEYNLTAVLQEKFQNKDCAPFNQDDLSKTQTGKTLLDLWNNHSIKSLELTTIGQIIGILVRDSTTGKSTIVDELKCA